MKQFMLNITFLIIGIFFLILGCYYSDFILAVSIGVILSTITNIIFIRFDERIKRLEDKKKGGKNNE